MREAWNNHDWLARSFFRSPKIITNRIFLFPSFECGTGTDLLCAEIIPATDVNKWLQKCSVNGRLVQSKLFKCPQTTDKTHGIGSSKEIALEIFQTRPQATTQEYTLRVTTRAFIIAIICFVFFDTQGTFSVETQLTHSQIRSFILLPHPSLLCRYKKLIGNR